MNFNNKIEKFYIKLGSSCNLHCKYCHSVNQKIDFNPEILPILKLMNLKHVTFGGGEPLLYWDLLECIVKYLGNGRIYRVVTNGTLFTQKIIDFCKQYNFVFGISFDGNMSTRDTSKEIQWDLISNLSHVNIVTTFYEENKDIEGTLNSLNGYKEKYLHIKPNKFSTFPNFIHSTKSTGVLSTHELAISYVEQVTEILDEAFRLFCNGEKTYFLKRCFEIYCRGEPGDGIRCCSETNICMLVNGDICSCPYTLDKVGDIFHFNDIDFKKVREKYLHKRCVDCDIFNICKNFCCQNITDDECYTIKNLHKNMLFLMKEYNISYNDLNESFYRF